MSTTVSPAPAPKTPLHLWIVAVLAVLWNAVGAFDYIATQLRLEGYMSQFSQEQLDYFYAFPAWAVAAWATAVWFALFGSLALLLRRRLAYPLFTISLAAMIVSTVHSFALTNGAEMMGSGGVVFSGVIAVVSILLVWYSKSMVARGVLR